MARTKRVKVPKTPRLVAVHWLDAAGDRHDVEPVDALTCGLLVEVAKREDGEQYLKVVSEIFPDGGYRDVTAIPVGMVRAVISAPLKLPAVFDGWRPRATEN